MANDEHLALIKQGVETWNTCRQENPDIRPDLSNADLDGAALAEADFRGVDLTGAQLHGAYLFGTDLRGATLSGASLLGASLFAARLENVDLAKERNLTKGQVQSAMTDSTTVVPDHIKVDRV